MIIEPLNLREARAAIKIPAPAEPKFVATEETAGPLFYGQYAGFGGTGSDVGFRRISQPAGIRDLLPPVQWRMQQVAYYLYITNPLARRIIELMKDFMVGEGVSIEVDDDAFGEVVDQFWEDPTNDVEDALECWCRELGIFGEQVLPAAENPINGRVVIGSIDPLHIEGVEYSTLAAWPGRAVAGASTVVLRRTATDAASPRMRVIAREEDAYSPNYGQLTGDCFYTAINKARAASRGISDLFAMADWLDGYDQMLFAAMQQVDSLSRFVWDVTLEGAGVNEIADWLKKNGRPPAANSVRAHNEKVKWEAVAPHLQAADKSEIVRLIKNFVLGGAGYPEHWFADGGHGNRATALQQGEPTLKMMTARQRKLRRLVRSLVNYIADRAVARGVLPGNVDRGFTVKMPDLSVGDSNTAATALQQAAAGLLPCIDRGLIDEATAVQIILALAHQIGVDADALDVLATAKAEKTQRDLEDFTKNPPPPMNGKDPVVQPNPENEQL